MGQILGFGIGEIHWFLSVGFLLSFQIISPSSFGEIDFIVFLRKQMGKLAVVFKG